jgi:hypothetical protein
MVEAKADHAHFTGDIFKREGLLFFADSLTLARAESEETLFSINFLYKRPAPEIIVSH